MAKRTVKTKDYGRKPEWERTYHTGEKNGVVYLIIELYSVTRQIRTLRFFPCADPQAFVEQGVQYASDVTASIVKEQLDQFQNVSVVTYDKGNPAHRVGSWVNMWTPEEQELVIEGDAPNERFSLTIELNVPATGMKFSYQGPFVSDQNHAYTALCRRFNAHFQGCSIVPQDESATIDVVKTPKTASKVVSGGDTDPLGIL